MYPLPRALTLLAPLAFALGLSGCGYSSLQQQDENVAAAWADVAIQYQRRADLIPNLVSTVGEIAAQEQRALLGVSEARAQVGSIPATPELVNDPGALRRFQAAQGQLSAALTGLFAVSQRYPALQSDRNFADLRSELQGAEERITLARSRYIDAVRAYNLSVRSFPTNLTAMLFKFRDKAQFAARDEAAIPHPR